MGWVLTDLLRPWRGQRPPGLVSAVKAMSALRALIPSQFLCIFLPLYCLFCGSPQHLQMGTLPWRNLFKLGSYTETWKGPKIDAPLSLQGTASVLVACHHHVFLAVLEGLTLSWSEEHSCKLLGCLQRLRQPRPGLLDILGQEQDRSWSLLSISCSAALLSKQVAVPLKRWFPMICDSEAACLLLLQHNCLVGRWKKTSEFQKRERNITVKLSRPSVKNNRKFPWG